MKRTLRACLSDRRGSTAVEFALAVTPLLMMILGGIELGRFAWTVQAVQAVATDAARCVGLRLNSCASSSNPSVALTQDYAIAAGEDWNMTLARSQVVVSSAGTCGGATSMSRVTVSYVFTAAGGMISALASVPVSASACFPNLS